MVEKNGEYVAPIIIDDNSTISEDEDTENPENLEEDS